MYLGNTMYGMYPVRCPVSASADHQERATIHDFPDGSRAATLYGTPSGARTWSTSYGALRPGDVEFLASFATQRSWYDSGRVSFIPTGGQRVNVLSREESALADLAGYSAAPVSTTDGPAYGSASPTTAAAIARSLPLPVVGEDRRLRISAYCAGTVSVGVAYYTAAGGWLSNYGFDLTGAGYSRASTLFPDVDRAVFVNVSMKGTFTRPAVTYGPDLWAWGAGQRIPSVIVSQDSEEIQWAPGLSAQTATYSKAAFTITELREGS